MGSSLSKPETKSASWTLNGSTATLATVKGAKSKAELYVSGDYEFDFAADYKKATITSGSSSDTVTGGKGNDSLLGNSYADKFICTSGDGKDFIIGFDNNDLL